MKVIRLRVEMKANLDGLMDLIQRTIKANNGEIRSYVLHGDSFVLEASVRGQSTLDLVKKALGSPDVIRYCLDPI